MDRARNNVVAAAALISVLLASFLVMRTSRAAFTAQTTNDANSFAAGALALTHDAPTSARFSASGWVPGDSQEECFDVTYTGTASSNSGIRLFAANLNDVDGGGGGTGAALQLSDDLDVVITILDPGETCATPAPTATGLFSDTLQAMAANHTGYADGIDPTWTPAGSPETRAFVVTVTLGADTADDAQGDSATVDLTWEIQAGV